MLQITPTQFQALINTINHHLQLANSTGSTVWENTLAVLTWHTSLIWYTPRFERVSNPSSLGYSQLVRLAILFRLTIDRSALAFLQELRNIEKIIDKANTELWNSKGLNILSPRGVALQYVSVPSDSRCRRKR